MLIYFFNLETEMNANNQFNHNELYYGGESKTIGSSFPLNSKTQYISYTNLH